MDKALLYKQIALAIEAQIAGLRNTRLRDQKDADDHGSNTHDRADSFKEDMDRGARVIESLEVSLSEGLHTFREIMGDHRALSYTGRIQVGSVFLLQTHDQELTRYVLCPSGFGHKIDHEGDVIEVVTNASLLGQALIGKQVGARVEVGDTTYNVLDLV